MENFGTFFLENHNIHNQPQVPAKSRSVTPRELGARAVGVRSAEIARIARHPAPRRPCQLIGSIFSSDWIDL